MKRNIYFLSLAIAATIVSSCGSNDSMVATAAQPVPVVVSTPSAATDNSIQASGQVTSSQTAAISTRVMGRITSLRVNVGDRVVKGQLLATISDEDIRAKRAQVEASITEAEAHLSAAEKDYNRYVNLYRQESATAKEMDMMTLQYNAAKSRVEAARQMRKEVSVMLGYTSLTAPFTGVVTQKLAEQGSIANPGMPILMIENGGNKEITATISETDINRIRVGQTATVVIKSTGVRFTGNIVQLNPSSQFSGAQYMIKVSIPASMQKDINAGMYVNLTMETTANTSTTPAAENITVPVSSIIYRDQLTGIYTVGANNTAVLRWLRLGRQYGDRVEVLSGLGKDERFIVSTQGKLVNGTKLKI
ncbi:MAG TPA: efflux RND transporter periplasmic adaptor subunit [Chitinophagaceae bacterium]